MDAPRMFWQFATSCAPPEPSRARVASERGELVPEAGRVLDADGVEARLVATHGGRGGGKGRVPISKASTKGSPRPLPCTPCEPGRKHLCFSPPLRPPASAPSAPPPPLALRLRSDARASALCQPL